MQQVGSRGRREARPRLAEAEAQAAGSTTSAHPPHAHLQALWEVSLSLSRVGVGLVPLYTFSPLFLHLFILLVKHAGALRCIVSASVKSVLKPKALINNSDEARKF